jgi:hypothetical protein
MSFKNWGFCLWIVWLVVQCGRMREIEYLGLFDEGSCLEASLFHRLVSVFFFWLICKLNLLILNIL